MSAFADFQIDPASIRESRFVTTARRPLNSGEVRFRVDEFALTANNITYATTGSFLGYLDFFPTNDDRWRRIPVMGHGDVIESAHDDITVGGRYFGFFPMAGEHVVQAERRGDALWDAGAHRTGHAGAYRRFEDVRRDPFYDPGREAQVALLRGLFLTSFLADDFLADNGCFGAQSVLITSAASKTSIALGYCLRRRGMASVGLTSAAHRATVVALDFYDTVITYDEVAKLSKSVPSTVVDMAGNGAVLSAIHTHFGDMLRYSCMVGSTHRDTAPRPVSLPGPAPQFFFAPGQIEKRNQEWGPGEVVSRVGTAFSGFLDYADTWLQIERGRGAEAVGRAYLDVVDGATAPTTGIILSLASS